MMPQYFPFINYKSDVVNNEGGLYNYSDITRDSLLRYDMHPSVAEAIERCLRDMPEEFKNQQGMNIFFNAESWPGMKPYIEMFKTAKVDPHIYLLDNDNYLVNSYGYLNTPVLSTFASMESPYNNTLGPASFWSDDNILKIKIRDCNTLNSVNKTISNTTSTCFLPYAKNNKTQFYDNTKKTVGYIHNCKLYNDKREGQYQSFIKYDTDKSLYDAREVKQRFSLLDAQAQFKDYTKIAWLGNRLNDNDGSYGPSNERPLGTKLMSYNNNNDKCPLGRYVFFVEIDNLPWKNNNGTPDDFSDDYIDNSLPPKQYIMFNALSLVTGSFQCTTSSKQYQYQTALTPEKGELNLNKDELYDFSYMGFGIIDGNEKIGNCKKSIVIPPFPYYIRKYTPFFKEENSVLLGTSYQYGATLQRNPYAVATGTTIYSKDKTEFLDFFNNGLGVTATDDYDVYKTAPTKDWVIPEPPKPDSQPGSGGQIGGNPGGGTGTGGTPEGDDSVPINPPTDATGGAALYNQYAMDPSSVQGLQECMVNNNIWDAVKNAFKSDFKEGIVNLIQFPYDIKPFLSNKVDETVKVIGINMDFEGISHYCKGIPINKNIKTLLKFGQFDIKERFGSFLDYEYTTLELYIPFVGKINLDTKAVMGRRIKILVDIDYNDGSCLATIWVTNRRNQWDKIEEKGYYPLSSHTGQIGNKISLAASDGLKNTLSKLESVVGVAASAGLAVATGGATSGLLAATAVNAGLSTMNTLSNPPTFSSGSPVNSNHTLSVSINCVLTAHYPETNFTPEQAKISGFSTHLYDVLGSQKGFTMCDNVKLNGIKCTDTEANELKSLLQEGVIINE